MEKLFLFAWIVAAATSVFADASTRTINITEGNIVALGLPQVEGCSVKYELEKPYESYIDKEVYVLHHFHRTMLTVTKEDGYYGFVLRREKVEVDTCEGVTPVECLDKNPQYNQFESSMWEDSTKTVMLPTPDITLSNPTQEVDKVELYQDLEVNNRRINGVKEKQELIKTGESCE